MNEVASLVQIGAAAAIVVAPVVLVRWLTGPEPVNLAELFRFRSDPPWPRGVQEEEPMRWKVELIGRTEETAEVPGCEPARHPAGDARLRPITTA